MKLKTLFIINAIVVIINGLGSIVAPNIFISLFGVTLNTAGANMMQNGGAWLVGLGLLAWLVRDEEKSKTRNAIVTAFLITYSLGLIVAVIGVLIAGFNVLGWMPVGINALLALGYAYFLLKN